MKTPPDRFPRELATELLVLVKELLATKAALVARGDQLRRECHDHGEMMAQTQAAIVHSCNLLHTFGVALPRECNILIGLNEDGTDVAF